MVVLFCEFLGFPPTMRNFEGLDPLNPASRIEIWVSGGRQWGTCDLCRRFADF